MSRRLFNLVLIFPLSSHYLALAPPSGSAVKESTCNAGDLGLIPGLGRSPGEGNNCPLQYSDLENSMDYIYSPWGRKESDITAQLSLTHPQGRLQNEDWEASGLFGI